MASKFVFNILLIGNLRTGKTQFMNKWKKDIFSDIYRATYISGLWFKNIEKNGKNYFIKIFDISGNDHNHLESKIFAKDCDGCIIMSDATNKKTREE